MPIPISGYSRKSLKEMAGAARLVAPYTAWRSTTYNGEAKRVTMLNTIS